MLAKIAKNINPSYNRKVLGYTEFQLCVRHQIKVSMETPVYCQENAYSGQVSNRTGPWSNEEWSGLINLFFTLCRMPGTCVEKRCYQGVM